MQPRFNVSREKNNKLFCCSYRNDFCTLQFHSQIEIYIVDEGEMEMFVDGKRKLLKKGEFSIALSYTPHAYKTPEISRSSVILIPPHLCDGFIEEINNKKLSTPFISDYSLYEKIKYYYTMIRAENSTRITQLGCVYCILGIILENAEFIDDNKTKDSELISKILLYINENFKNDISLNTISAHFGYNPSYISRYFKSCCGITLVKFISLTRLHNTLMLLNNSKHDIAYCALESGFSSIRTFYRTFHNEFNCSPKAYIQQIH